MAKIWQLRTKTKINSKIGAGFIFNVPSVWSTDHPTDAEIRDALEKIGGKDATSFSSWASYKYEVLS